MKRAIYILLLALSFSSEAQDFINNDLDGPPITSWSVLPYNWQAVPFTDTTCLASWISGATPDLTDSLEPNSLIGIPAYAYSGTTFVSGVISETTSSLFQEGIMQTVSGFTVGTAYSVNFFQSVVKQINCLDSSGAWHVYIDDSLAGTSQPTWNYQQFSSLDIPWEHRTINFIANSNSHTIKFLPADDDLQWLTLDSSALRMGIDSIYISLPKKITSLSIKNTALGKMKVYPNPFSHQFKIEGLRSSTPIRITDILGKEVEVIRNGNVIDGSNWERGFYFLRADGITIKIVKR